MQAIAPKLPKRVFNVLNSVLGRIIMVFLIGFMSSNNIQLSLIIATLYVITLTYLNKENFRTLTMTMTTTTTMMMTTMMMMMKIVAKKMKVSMKIKENGLMLNPIKIS